MRVEGGNVNDVVVIALGQGEGRGIMGSGEQVVKHHGCSGAVGDLVVGPRGGG